MNKINTYSLEELAEDFGLTPRTARHYIEHVLPTHHKKGRGKLASYGQDTWNCFAFIQKVRQESKFTSAQLSDVLASLDQQQIDRVADGREDLRVVTAPSLGDSRMYSSPGGYPAASRRAKAKLRIQEPHTDFALKSEMSSLESKALFEQSMDEEDGGTSSWQELYADEQLRISFKGRSNQEQQEKVQLAAELIKKILTSGS
jgi:hypothetical protein